MTHLTGNMYIICSQLQLIINADTAYKVNCLLCTQNLINKDTLVTTNVWPLAIMAFVMKLYHSCVI